MYNYLSSIFLLIASINYGPTFVLTCSSIYNYYNQCTRSNAYKLALMMSLYLFGFSYTLYYSIICSILSNYDIMIQNFVKIKKELSGMMEFYNNEKNINPEKISYEIELIQKIIKKYNDCIIQFDFYKSKLIDNNYYQIISEYLHNADYEYYIAYVNAFIERIIEITYDYIDSNPNIKNYKYIMNDYLRNMEKFSAKINVNENVENNITANITANIPTNYLLNDIEKLGNMNDMMENMMKQMNINDFQNMNNMTNLTNISDFQNMINLPTMSNANKNIIQKGNMLNNDKNNICENPPNIDDINKLMATLNTLQKMSQDMEGLNPSNNNSTTNSNIYPTKLSRAQRRFQDKKNKKI